MLRFALAVAVVSLVLAPFDWPYGYYQLLRIIVTGAIIWLLVEVREESHPAEVIILSLLAISYNPVFKISMERDVHTVINFVTIIIIAVVAYRHREMIKSA
jgi:hypothetical protein